MSWLSGAASHCDTDRQFGCMATSCVLSVCRQLLYKAALSDYPVEACGCLMFLQHLFKREPDSDVFTHYTDVSCLLFYIRVQWMN